MNPVAQTISIPNAYLCCLLGASGWTAALSEPPEPPPPWKPSVISIAPLVPSKKDALIATLFHSLHSSMRDKINMIMIVTQVFMYHMISILKYACI